MCAFPKRKLQNMKYEMKYGSKSQWTDCSALENVKKGGAWVSCFSQGVPRSDPFWQGAWVQAQLWNATAAIFFLENRWFPDFCSWKLTQIGHAQRPASQPASQPRERVQILQKIKQNYYLTDHRSRFWRVTSTTAPAFKKCVFRFDTSQSSNLRQ